MTMKQKFGYLASAKHAEIGERELPELAPNEVLVKAAHMQHLHNRLSALDGSQRASALPNGWRP